MKAVSGEGNKVREDFGKAQLYHGVAGLKTGADSEDSAAEPPQVRQAPGVWWAVCRVESAVCRGEDGVQTQLEEPNRALQVEMVLTS